MLSAQKIRLFVHFKIM